MKEYIEREAAENAIRNDLPLSTWMKRSVDKAAHAMGVTVDAIEAIPAADVVEVRHGEWRDDADKIDKRFHRHDFFCKKCNTRADYFIGGEGNWWSSCAPDYCPKCGARMDGGVNDA